MSKKRARLFFILGVVLLLALWQMAAFLLSRPLFMPYPGTVCLYLLELVREPVFYQALGATLLRLVICFSVSLLVGTLLSFLGYWRKELELLMQPMLALAKSLPTMAVIMLLLVWFSAQTAPVVVGFLVLMPLLHQASLSGLKNADVKLLQMARVFRVPRFQVWRCILIPSATHSIVSQMPAVGSLGLKVVIAAEILGQPLSGIGNSLQQAKMALDVPAVMSWLIVATVIAVSGDFLWRGKNKTRVKPKPKKGA